MKLQVVVKGSFIEVSLSKTEFVILILMLKILLKI